MKKSGADNNAAKDFALTVKTIKEWFDLLDEPIRSRALKNLNPAKADKPAKSESDAVKEGFRWDHTTDKGKEKYWIAVYDRLVQKERMTRTIG